MGNVSQVNAGPLLNYQMPNIGLTPTSKRPTMSQRAVVTILQSGHGWTVNSGTGTLNDTTDPAIGNQCCSVTTLGAGAQAGVNKLNYAAIDMTGKCFRVLVRITDITHCQKIAFYAGDNSLTNFVNWVLTINATTLDANYIQSNEWVWITLNWAEVASTGSPTRSAVTALRFAVYDDNTGNTVKASIQAIETVPDGHTAFPNGVISLCFDDPFSTEYTNGKPAMDAYGYPGSIYVIADQVNAVNRFTMSQLRNVQDISGWEVGGHAYALTTHNARFTTLPASVLDTDLALLKNWLLVNGFRSDGLAWPGGSFNQSTVDIAAKYFGYARTIFPTPRETLPPANLYRLRAISSISSYAGGVSIASVQAAITACKNNQTWLPLVFHSITAAGATSTTECSLADFNTILAAIAAAGVPVMTVRDVLSSGFAA